MDPVTVAIALGLLAAGWLLGRHARLKSAPKASKPLQPICMCEHHYGTHDPETGECQEQYTERVQETPGGYYGDVWVSCSCVRYTGPQPIEQYWVPPAADMSIVVAPRAVERDGGRLMPDNSGQMCPGQPLPVGDTIPVCGHFAAHFPHAIGESVRYRAVTDQPLGGA